MPTIEQSFRATPSARRRVARTRGIQRDSGNIWVRFAFNRLKKADVRRWNSTIKPSHRSTPVVGCAVSSGARRPRTLSVPQQYSTNARLCRESTRTSRATAAGGGSPGIPTPSPPLADEPRVPVTAIAEDRVRQAVQMAADLVPPPCGGPRRYE